MKLWRLWTALALWLIASVSTSSGYFVSAPMPLEKMEGEADFIFKGEAITTEPVEDPWFKPVPGFAPRATRFRVISQIKGDPAGVEVRFCHYDYVPKDAPVMTYTPQFYHFEPGRIYIVSAHKADADARQLWPSHTGKMDLGVLRCFDQRPVVDKTLRQIYWTELMALRDSAKADDVLYSIRQLDEMSEIADAQFSHTSDFARVDVLTAVHTFMARPEPEIAQAAIRLVAAGCPYLSDDTAPQWLGTIGVPNPSFAQMDPGTRNVGGALCWRELAAVANSQAPPETRALAIRALGLVKQEALRRMVMDSWMEAPEPPIRAAAALLLADFADRGPYSGQQFEPLVADAAPEVRKNAAFGMGFVQNPVATSLLVRLLKDEEATVRRAALESLLSFSPKHPAVAAAFKRSLGIVEFQPLFLLALARENPAERLEALARVVEQKTEPKNGSLGEIPAFTAWKLLFQYVWERPTTELHAGKWDRYFNALEQVGNYGSSDFVSLYAFYIKRSLPKRAARWRVEAQRVTYDLGQYFDRVDKFPAGYLTEYPPAR